ncbi:MAG: PilZ domain-containing protein [Saprospiraceae bacterium]|nr:PilZ domain-containing protein [Pyrinomonadaceae bacterium]
MPREQNRIQIPMEILLDSASGKREARISDLSIGGCFVDSIASFPEGERMQFELRLPDSTVEKMTGEVSYVIEGNGFGMKFVGLSEKQTALISWIITENGGTP